MTAPHLGDPLPSAQGDYNQGVRSSLQRIVQQLLHASSAGGVVTLDAIGDAIGVLAISSTEVDEIIEALEKAGRTVSSPARDGVDDLRRVLNAARQLREAHGRAPTVEELASKARLEPAAVRAALMLAEVMGRS